MKPTITCLIQSSCLVFSSSLFSLSAIAQITPDATVPTNVNQSSNVAEITGGAEKGNNLFHSFKEFSVFTGNEAFFNNASNIENIFSRIIGGSISNIDGLIRANGNANLFLINPNGIIFGENARLDVGGSFLATTADSINFPDSKFSAVDLDNPPVLTINAPIGLGFRDKPAPIINRSSRFTESLTTFASLGAGLGANLTLVGGDIIFDGGNATARGGRVNLGGLSESGTVTINENGSLRFPEGIERADVTFTNSAFVDLDLAEAGGSITVNARNIDISENSLLLARGGDILLNVTDSIAVREEGRIFILNNFVDEVSNFGKIEITTANLSLTQGGTVSAITIGQGNGGAIRINATDTISLDGESLDGFGSGIFNIVESNGSGNSGGIDINTSSLFVTNNAKISVETRGERTAGTLQINATELLEVSGLGSGLFNRTGGTGDAGTLEIITSELKIRDNGQVGVNNFIETDLQIEPVTDQFGNPIRDRFGNPITRLVPIFNPREGSGNAGKLDITVASLQLEAGGSIAAQSAGGNGGNIQLKVDESILLRRNSSISTTAGLQGTGGDGGNIDIDAKFIIAPPNENSDITANAFNGSGGNIDITAEGVFGLEERSSTPLNRTNDIDASSEFGLDGRVLINTPDVSALQEAIEPPKIVELQTLDLNACSSSGESESSSFELTGKGGVPPQLTEPLSSDGIFTEGESISIGKGQSERVQTEPIKPLVTAQGQIYPARGIVFLENGDIILTAYPTDNVQRIPHSSANCRKS